MRTSRHGHVGCCILSALATGAQTIVDIEADESSRQGHPWQLLTQSRQTFDGIFCPFQADVSLYLLLRAVDRFYQEYHRYPGSFDEDIDEDIAQLKVLPSIPKPGYPFCFRLAS